MEWIRNLGRKDLLNYTPERLYKQYRVCEDHFEDDQFVNLATKNRLVPFAVPTIVDLPMLTPELFSIQELLSKREVIKEKQEVINQGPEVTELKPEVTELKPEVAEQKLEIMEQRPEVTELKPEVNDQRPEVTCLKREITEHKPKICRTCGAIFDSEDSLKTHCCVELHVQKAFHDDTNDSGETDDTSKPAEEKPHVCEKCCAVFTEEEHLIIHKQTHKGELFFVCGECKEVFTLQVDLEKHIQTQHRYPQSGGSLGCVLKEEPKDDTSRNLSQKSCVMKSEIQSDDNNDIEEPEESQNSEEFTVKSRKADNCGRDVVVKRHECSQCDKSFAHKTNLTVHLIAHSNEKSYQCNQCDKAFTYKKNLTRHLRGHSGEKPYHCDQCDKAFLQNSDLTKHIRTHSGEKPYLCDQCDRGFTVKSALIVHQRTHSGEKPYINVISVTKHLH